MNGTAIVVGVAVLSAAAVAVVFFTRRPAPAPVMTTLPVTAPSSGGNLATQIQQGVGTLVNIANQGAQVFNAGKEFFGSLFGK